MTNSLPRIWIIDDESDTRAYLIAALEDERFDVQAFPGADGVVAAAREDPPDLICMDVVMPKRSGLSLYRELRAEHALDTVPVVVLSGYARPEEDLETEFVRLLRDETIRAPDGFLDKPVVLDRFLSLVASLVRDQKEKSA